MSLKIGWVGTGGFSRIHVEQLMKMDDVSISAICSSSLASAERATGQFNNAKAYESVDDMLNAEQLDAVYICVPPFAHGRIEQALIERRIPFLTEKPIGTNDEIPASIEAAIRESGLITSVGYNFRYLESTDRMKELLRGEQVGMALGSWNGGLPGVAWWRKQEQSGGQFVEQTTHIVDLTRYLLGEVTEVYAAYANRGLNREEQGIEVPDVGSVTLKMESGAIVTILNTCLLPMGYQAGLTVMTSQGALEFSAVDRSLTEITNTSRKEYFNTINAYELENQAFIHAVRTGDVSGIRSSYSDAYRTHQVTMAANESARIGLPVRIG